MSKVNVVGVKKNGEKFEREFEKNTKKVDVRLTYLFRIPFNSFFAVVKLRSFVNFWFESVDDVGGVNCKILHIILSFLN